MIFTKFYIGQNAHGAGHFEHLANFTDEAFGLIAPAGCEFVGWKYDHEPKMKAKFGNPDWLIEMIWAHKPHNFETGNWLIHRGRNKMVCPNPFGPPLQLDKQYLSYTVGRPGWGDLFIGG